jgi:hypothetical protein
MLTRARTWYSHHAVALAAAGLWAAGLGLAAANALQLSSSSVSVGVETSEVPSDEAVPGAEESTTTAKVAAPPAVFLPEDTIVAHRGTSPAAGAAQMQKPTG